MYLLMIKLNSVILTPADIVITSTKTGPLTLNTNGTVKRRSEHTDWNIHCTIHVCEGIEPNNCDTATVGYRQ
jgi:hypothetical protein